MRITKDTPADSHVETLAAHYMGEWLDSIAETSSGMIAQTLRDALSPETPEAMRARMWPTLDRPDAELREERGLWSGPVEFRRVISNADGLRDGNEVAVFAFVWEVPGFPRTPFFNTTRPVAEYPEGATIGADTLKRLGYTTPTIPASAAHAA